MLTDRVIITNTKESEKQFYGTGHRKNSCARVFIKRGDGTVLVNKKNPSVYFKSSRHGCEVFLDILRSVGIEEKFNMSIFVTGGGLMGQFNAVQYGIAKSLLSYGCTIGEDFFINLKKKIRELGLVTRDARRVERKKFGLRKARKRKQYSKR
jgi:small subunit ribosomal protein S9